MSNVPKSWPILIMCAGVFLLALNDACGKWLVDRYSPLQILFGRSLVALPLTLVFAYWFGGSSGLTSSVLRVHALRGFVSVIAASAFIFSLGQMPLAQATTLIFTAPLFIALLSILFLKERIGTNRVIALFVGFAGVMIVLRPGTSTFQSAALLPVAAAALYAVIMLTARKIPKHETIWTMMVYMTVFPLLFSAIVIFTEWPVIKAWDVLLIAGMALFATLGLALISDAFRLADAALVAPFDYTALLWASLLGWLVFDEMPDIWTYAGGAAIIAGSIYLVWSESRSGRQNA